MWSENDLPMYHFYTDVSCKLANDWLWILFALLSLWLISELTRNSVHSVISVPLPFPRCSVWWWANAKFIGWGMNAVLVSIFSTGSDRSSWVFHLKNPGLIHLCSRLLRMWVNTPWSCHQGFLNMQHKLWSDDCQGWTKWCCWLLLVPEAGPVWEQGTMGAMRWIKS